MKKLLVFVVVVSLVFSCSCISIVKAPSTAEQPVINSFDASPQNIQAGKSAKLVWNVKGAAKVNIDQGIGDVSSIGYIVVSPGSTTVYTLTATGLDGTKVTAITQVAISIAGSPVINSFSVSPSTITTGSSATLSWSIDGATSVSIDNGIGTVPASGSKTVSPTSTTGYTLTASNASGTTGARTRITVLPGSSSPTPTPPPPPPGSPTINQFIADSYTLTGSSVTLSWNVSNATTITIYPAFGAVAATGSRPVSPTSTTVYTLTATNSIGSVYQSLQIIVPESGITGPGVTHPGVTMPGTTLPSQVTSVITTVSPTTWDGARPYTFRCSAMIRVSGACTVTYVWERSDGGSSPQQTEYFTAAGSKEVTTGWPREENGSYWVRVHVLTPNDVVSNQANFTLAPVEGVANRVTAVRVYCDVYQGASYSNVYMSVSGPCTATFVVERSDGWTSTVYTQKFNYAGDGFGVGTRLWWTPSTSGTYWWRVHVFTPNEMWSDKCNFTFGTSVEGTAIAVTSVIAGVIPTSYVGHCPHDFVCYADITVNTPCTVRYVWERSDGGTSPEQTINFTSATTTRVNTGWSRGTTGTHWVRVRTLSPNVVVSNPATFSLQCQ